MLGIIEISLLTVVNSAVGYWLAKDYADRRIKNYIGKEREALLDHIEAQAHENLKLSADKAVFEARYEVAARLLEAKVPQVLKAEVKRLLSQLPIARARSAVLARQLESARDVVRDLEAELADMSQGRAEPVAVIKEQPQLLQAEPTIGDELAQAKIDNAALRSQVERLRGDNMRLSGKVERQAVVIAKRDATIEVLDRRLAETTSSSANESGADLICCGTEETSAEERFAKTALSVEWKINGAMVTVPLPHTFYGMRAWADRWLGDKVVLTEKAEAAASAVLGYKNVPLVYKALLLLATRAEMMRNVPEAKAYYDDKLKELRLRCGGVTVNIGKNIQGQYSATVDGEQVAMDRSLKGNNSFDPTIGFRAYFKLDEPKRRIIVGHLPTHLDNRLS